MLASAALRMTNQFKQSGELDSMLSGWIDAIGQSGPVRTADLVADLETQTSPLRENLHAEGVTDEIWSNVIENLKKVDATLFAQDGKLVAQLKVLGQDNPRKVVFVHSATGMPQTLSDLLRRGSYERLASIFLKTGGLKTGGPKLQLLPGPERELELAEVILSGSILSVQSVAEHTRRLRDTGLAKYAGSSGIAILAIAILAAWVIGAILKHWCGRSGDVATAACVVGNILEILASLGFLALLGWGMAGVPPVPPGFNCGGGAFYFDFATQQWRCGHDPNAPPD
jgi:hypothetical protein